MAPQGSGFPLKPLPQIQCSPTLKTESPNTLSGTRFMTVDHCSNRYQKVRPRPKDHYLRSGSASLCQDFNNVTSSFLPHYVPLPHSCWEEGLHRKASAPGLPLGAAAHLQKSASHRQSPVPGAGPSAASCNPGERERDVRRACWGCSANHQFLATQGDWDSYSLNSIFTREGTDTGTRMSQ